MRQRTIRPAEPPEPPGLTVGELLDAYERHCAADGVHSEEAAAHRVYIFKLFRAVHGDRPAAECKPFHLTDFIESNASWKSSATKRMNANCVRAAFRWAADGERIDRNPFCSVRYGEPERRPAMADSILGDLIALGNKPFERALRFLRLTGCRLSELCSAKWADVDLEHGAWTIPRHKSRRYTGKPKVVALVRQAIELLQSIAARQPTDIGGVIFLNTHGTAWTRRTLAQQLTRMQRRHGIETPARLHGIRHAAATAMIAGGASVKLVAEQLGHSTTTITERLYWHRSAEHLGAIRQAVELGLPGSAAE